jgi:hypothetical protein
MFKGDLPVGPLCVGTAPRQKVYRRRGADHKLRSSANADAEWVTDRFPLAAGQWVSVPQAGGSFRPGAHSRGV